MEAFRVILIACFVVGVVHAQADIKNQAPSDHETCKFNEGCKSVHMIHSIINNNIICCLNGQFPSVSITNNKIICSCGSAFNMIGINSGEIHTMTPEQQHKFEENLQHSMNALRQKMNEMEQRLHQSLDGLGAKIAASVQKAIG